jgi:hypothetical protein
MSKIFFRRFLGIFAGTPREGEIDCPNNSGGDSSAGPARGYLDRGDLTAEKFAFVPPERLPRIALPVAYTIGFRELAKHLHEPYLPCIIGEAERRSWWLTVSLSLAALAATAALFAALAMLLSIFPMSHVQSHDLLRNRQSVGFAPDEEISPYLKKQECPDRRTPRTPAFP